VWKKCVVRVRIDEFTARKQTIPELRPGQVNFFKSTVNKADVAEDRMPKATPPEGDTTERDARPPAIEALPVERNELYFGTFTSSG
jgi:hypothetical protein